MHYTWGAALNAAARLRGEMRVDGEAFEWATVVRRDRGLIAAHDSISARSTDDGGQAWLTTAGRLG
jgi:hypothetical protein